MTINTSNETISSAVDFVLRLPVLIQNYSEASERYPKNKDIILSCMHFVNQSTYDYNEWIKKYGECRDSLPKSKGLVSVASERIIAGLYVDNIDVSSQSNKLALEASRIRDSSENLLYKLQECMDKVNKA